MIQHISLRQQQDLDFPILSTSIHSILQALLMQTNNKDIDTSEQNFDTVYRTNNRQQGIAEN